MIFKLRKTQSNTQTPDFTILKNKKAVTTLWIIAILLIVLTVLYATRADILMTVAPREYAAYSLSKTLKHLDRETGILSKKLLGFEINKETDFTLENSLVSAKEDTPFDKLKVSYAPKQSTMLVNAEGIELYGERVNTNILWDNEIIGMQIPQLTDDKHFAVSSENFGEQIADTKLKVISDLLKKKGLDFGNADISFDNIMGEGPLNKKENKKLKKKITAAAMDLMQTGKIKEKETQKIEIDGKKKKAYFLTMDFEGTDIRTFLNETASIIENNETASKSLVHLAESLRNTVQKTDFKYKATVSLVLKSDKIIAINIESKKHNIHVLTKFEGVKSMLDGFFVDAKIGKNTFGITTSGNIIPRKGKVKHNIVVNHNGKHTDADIKLDYKSNTAQIILDIGKEKNITLKGTCSNKDGFELLVSSKDLKVDLSISEGARVQNLTGSRYMILEKSVAAIGWDLAPLALLNKTARRIITGFTKQWLNK